MVKHFLEVFFLHAYSPELNPDEYINGDLKGIVHSSPAIRSVKELKQRTRSSMRKLQRKPDQVRSYFRSKHIAYAA
ncbi:transposase [Zobellella taiwanensis]